MRSHFLSLEVKASVAAGAGSKVSHLDRKWARVSGTFTATLALEVSLDDGVTYFPVVSGINAAATHEIPQACTHVRANTTAFTSGAPAVRVSGWDWNG